MIASRFTLALTLVFGLAAVVGCGGKQPSKTAQGQPQQQEAAAVRVSTVKPERKTITRVARAPGQIDAFQTAPLYAKVAGYVRRFHVDIGDSVKGPYYGESGEIVERGQLLAEISIPELDQELREKAAAVVEAEAEVLQARAALKVARANVRTAEAQLEQARAAVDEKQADRERWESEYERIVKLAKSSSINAKVVDETKNKLRAAEAACRDAASQVDTAEAVIDQSLALVEKAAADETAAAARKGVAEADQARVQALAEYQRVEAPFDGTVSERNTDEGHFVQPAEAAQSRPLFTIVRTNVVRIFVDIPDLDASLVDRGDRVVVRLDALGGKQFPGSVSRTSWALNPATRTLRVEIDVPNESGELRPGMYAFATIVLDERPETLAIPLAAVRTAEGKTSCFRLVGEKLAQTPVSLGLSDGESVEVLSGLKESDVVVAKNAPSLDDGQRAAAAKSASAKPSGYPSPSGRG